MGTLTPISPAVLALQGSVEPHHQALQRLGYPDAPRVKKPEDLKGVTHLLIPGGECTTLYKLLDLYGLWGLISQRATAGELAILGTCAGAILLGSHSEERPPRWGLIDATVHRNAYGRQLDSFVGQVEPCGTLRDAMGVDPLEGVFIRAPRLGTLGAKVEVLGVRGQDHGTRQNPSFEDSEPVLVLQGRCVAATFHPELTAEDRHHRWFLQQ